MGLFFGALGMIVRSSQSDIALTPSPIDRLLQLVELRSLFLGLVFVVVSLILAYLTNPKEQSFRTYLTELSFRRHLSKLYDSQDPEPDEHDEDSGLHTPKRQPTKHPYKSMTAMDSKLVGQGSLDSVSGFHFANRASVNLRTPAHVFRSFGLFTLAAVPIISDAESDRTPFVSRSCRDSPSATENGDVTLAGTWFIGAFGKWWFAGTLQLLQNNVVFSNKDAPLTPGILSIRALDREGASDGYKHTSELLPSVMPKARKASGSARDRHKTRRSTPNGSGHHVPPRSSTPPPLPKSVSLPLHTSRLPPSTPENNRIVKHASPSQSHSFSSPISEATANNINLLDQSPIIVDIMKQLTASQAEAADMRAQLITFQIASSAAHDVLQQSIDQHREKKRDEDAMRLDLKSRNKVLEESKRNAEGTKRDSEKKLKAAQASRDRATSRIEQLAQDIIKLQARMTDNESRVVHSGIEASAIKAETLKLVEEKRREIKVAEDVIAALLLRARELEGQIEEEKAALERVKAEAAVRRATEARTNGTILAPTPSTRPPPPNGGVEIDMFPISSPPPDKSSSPPMSLFQRRQIAQGSEPEPLSVPNTAGEAEVSRPRTLSLQGQNDLYITLPVAPTSNSPQPPLNGPRKSITNLSIPFREGSSDPSPVPSSTVPHVTTTRHSAFSPFADVGMPSPSASLIPAGLFTSLDSEGMSPRTTSARDFAFPQVSRNVSSGSDSQLLWNQQPTSDARIRQRWDEMPEVLYTSPTATTFNPHPHSLDHRVPHTPSPERPITQQSSPSYRFPSPPPHSNPLSNVIARQSRDSLSLHVEEEKGSSDFVVKPSRRWFASSSTPLPLPKKESSNLNPDAKAFSFTRGRSFLFPSSGGASQQNAGSGSEDRTGLSLTRTLSDSSSRYQTHNSTTSLPVTTSTNSNSTSTSPGAASFLSSLLAFTPSPAEREALQRALSYSHANGSLERLSDHSSPSLTHPLPQSPFTSPLPSARSSAVDLISHSGIGGGVNGGSGRSATTTWDGMYIPSANVPAPKRSFSSLWNRSKASGNGNGNGHISQFTPGS